MSLDIFPQPLRVLATQPSTNGFVQVQIPTGLEALRASENRGTKRTAMEILKIIHVIPMLVVAGDRFYWTLSTVSDTAPRNLSERGVIYQFDREFVGDASNGLARAQRDEILDLTCGGIGQLICSDNLYLQLDSEDLAGAQSMYMQIFFRYVKIGLQEFVDIAQSQMTYT